MVVEQNLQGVILAAGRGSRVEWLSTHMPKPLLPVCNKPIMQYQIEMMKGLGIGRILVVVSHLKEKIVEAFGDGSGLGVEIEYVEQQQVLGIAHALAQVESRLDSPFLLTLGDIFLLTKDLNRMIEVGRNYAVASVLAVKRETNPEYIRRNFAVEVTDGRLVRRVIEKPRHVVNDLKGCGMYLFSPNIFDAIRRTPRTAMRDEYEITDSIQILIDDGYPVFAEEVIREDLNVTYARDLLTCSQLWMKEEGRQTVQGERVDLAEGCQVINSVIGSDVTIEMPIRIQDSVIFSDQRIGDGADIVDCVVAAGRTIR